MPGQTPYGATRGTSHTTAIPVPDSAPFGIRLLTVLPFAKTNVTDFKRLYNGMSWGSWVLKTRSIQIYL